MLPEHSSPLAWRYSPQRPCSRVAWSALSYHDPSTTFATALFSTFYWWHTRSSAGRHAMRTAARSASLSSHSAQPVRWSASQRMRSPSRGGRDARGEQALSEQHSEPLKWTSAAVLEVIMVERLAT